MDKLNQKVNFLCPYSFQVETTQFIDPCVDMMTCILEAPMEKINDSFPRSFNHHQRRLVSYASSSYFLRVN